MTNVRWGGTVVVALTLGVLVLGWPYLLGDWVAGSLGAGAGVRTGVAWALEGAYLAGLPLAVALSRRSALGVGRVSGVVLPVVYGVFGIALLAATALLFTA
ncbi:hypothetical protein J2S43_001927 [Catenuloplanes nepalensis]|uniref:Uncharacterized protein n=1 Tax=Catenuloplanes nepalensis TaxID=587533 RepID=A0ABT9MPR6_9ACTN|nr:hypothetical protein [Catenuloplanes nepalensis]MDP9793415.1 hypothetical protein [Catenuloplanes nepalensis]